MCTVSLWLPTNQVHIELQGALDDLGVHQLRVTTDTGVWTWSVDAKTLDGDYAINAEGVSEITIELVMVDETSTKVEFELVPPPDP